MYNQYEAKRKKTAEEIAIAREKEIQNAKNEIANLQVILKAIPMEEIGAREIILDQIETLRHKLPKFEGRIWWHWLLEHCPTCGGVSQSPLAENIGEDCDLFEKVQDYNEKQREGETNYTCSCGKKLVMRYRHATADMTEEQKQEAYAAMING